MRLLKEAEMRAIKYAGLVAVLLAPVAMATTADITYTVVGAAFDPSFNPIDINGIPATPPAPYPVNENGNYIAWTMSVAVTGDNQGLAGFLVDLGVAADGAQMGTWAPIYMGPKSDPFARYWSAVYKAPGAAATGTVKDPGGAGGPGLNVLPSLGDEAAGDVAFIAQMGAALLDWNPRVYNAKSGWSGDQVWGVGLDSRKTVMLQAGAAGTYDLISGYIYTAGLPAGKYNVMLLPTGSAVLKSGIDLNSAQSGVTQAVATSNLHAVGFSFIIVPEPATMLLLAGAGLLVRRRRA
jgi:hypothetical protein